VLTTFTGETNLQHVWQTTPEFKLAASDQIK